MRRFKRYLAAMLSLLMILSVTACGKQTKPTEETEKTEPTETVDESTDDTALERVFPLGEVTADDSYKIGFSVGVEDQFLATIRGAVVSKGGEMKVKVETLFAEDNYDVQLAQIAELADLGCDAIIASLASTENVEPAIEAAGDVPIVFVNRKPVQDDLLVDNKVIYVGSDEAYAGRQQGEYLASYFEGKDLETVKYILLRGKDGLHNTMERSESAIKALEDAGLDLESVYEASANWDRIEAKATVLDVLNKELDVDCIVANNDLMALGAIDALKEVDNEKYADVQIVGIDAIPLARVAIQNGDLAFTVFQDGESQGVTALRAAVALANGDDVPKLLDIPFIGIDSGNIDALNLVDPQSN